LLKFQVDRLTLKVDYEMSIENKEKFVVIVMLVPMVLPLDTTTLNVLIRANDGREGHDDDVPGESSLGKRKAVGYE
jgi:hypothetical protein